jgi:hypothetical protein
MKQNVLYGSCFVDADTMSWLLYLLTSPDTHDNIMAKLLHLLKQTSVQRILVEANEVGLIVDAVNIATKAKA